MVDAVVQVLAFARENIAGVVAEIRPLAVAHHREVGEYPDIPIELDLGRYQAAESIGALRIFTARREGKLIGYAVFFVQANAHHRQSLQAALDGIFLAERGEGFRFIRWCDDELVSEGVEVVLHAVKASNDYGRMLERIGYTIMDHVYSRRLT